MSETKESISVQRNYKDTIFRMLFKEKENLLSLYNALNGTHYTDSSQLEIVTLENAIFMNMKNDLAFLMDSYLNLYEHQTTHTPNMPLRDLFYIAKEYEKLIDSKHLYGSTAMKIPTPRFMVFYNGVKDMPAKQILRLSDLFQIPTDEPQLELVVCVININTGKNDEILEACRMLKEYMLYVDKVRENAKEKSVETAVKYAVDYCIEHDILKEFLLKNKKEAIAVSIFEYDEEATVQYIREEEYKQGLEQGKKQGLEQGIKQGKKQGIESEQYSVIERMLKKKIHPEEIAALTGYGMEKVLQIQKQIHTVSKK